MDGIHQRQQLARAIAVAERGERDDRPDRAVRVLPPVLPDSGRVRLDVPGVGLPAVEGRREQEDEAVATPHEVPVHGVHGGARPGRIPSARDHRPGLRDRVDPARRTRARAERRPVVEVRAPVPVSVPCLTLDRIGERARVLAPAAGALALGSAAALRDRREGVEVRAQEPREPDALSLAADADPVHAVVPVARSHERKAVRADGEAAVERAGAVLVQVAALAGLGRDEVALGLALLRSGSPPRNGIFSSRIASSPVTSR